jgi:adenylate cyclase
MGPVPLQSQEIPLFETHLHAINTLVTGHAIREFNGSLSGFLTFLIWLPMLFAAVRLSALRGALVGLLPLLLYPLIGLGLFGWGSVLISFAWPFSFLLGSYVGLLAFYLLVVERARQRARDSFARYFSDQVVERILADPEGPHLGGRRAQLTILFSDIKGFTTTSEHTDPDLLVEFLGDYFDRMVEIVFRHQGTVDKFMGDGLMAFWGDPVEQEDQADRAFQAAQEMQQAAGKIHRLWHQRLGAALQIRIGINSGPVSVGNMGGRRRMEYTVLGRAVNLAQRLESAATPGGILLGESCHQQLSNPPPELHPREVRVKGIEGLVKAYEFPPAPPENSSD